MYIYNSFIALYSSVSKNEERNFRFEYAIGYLQENLYKVLKYFHIGNSKKNEADDNIFADFLRLSNYLVGQLTKNKFSEE